MKNPPKYLVIITVVAVLSIIGFYAIVIQPTELGISDVSNQEVQEDETYQAYQIRAEYQLFPPDEQSFDADFDKAYKEFVKAVRNKDLSVLESFLYGRIQTSPYDEDPKGLNEFYDYWDIESVLQKETEVWAVLEEIIELGGRYDEAEKSFVAPYTYFDCPEEYQDESDYCFIVTSKNVNLYAERKINSQIISKLDYNIIYLDKGERAFSEKTGNDLVKINTPSGLKGYIQKKYMRFLLDYRLKISYVYDGWKLMYLVYGK